MKKYEHIAEILTWLLFILTLYVENCFTRY